jgi:hypothetical protein
VRENDGVVEDKKWSVVDFGRKNGVLEYRSVELLWV